MSAINAVRREGNQENREHPNSKSIETMNTQITTGCHPRRESSIILSLETGEQVCVWFKAGI